MILLINMYRSIQCPEGTGTTGERLFEEQTQCTGCRVFFPYHLLKESQTVGGCYCKDCWEVEEAAHIASPDYDGSKFN